MGQWIPMDSPTYPTWYSGIGLTIGFGGPEWDSGFPWTVPPVLHGTGQTVGLGLHLGKGGIQLDSPMYPTWTLGMVDIHRKSKFPVNMCNRHRTGGKGTGCP